MDKEIKVNDGGGLYDSSGMIDSLIVDCEKGMKALLAGHPLEYATITIGMVKKLSILKGGIQKDTESLKKEIEELSRILQEDERGKENDSGSVCDTLDGAVGSGEERLRDVITAEESGLERNTDNTGA